MLQITNHNTDRILADMITDEVSRAIRPFHLGRIEISVEGMPEFGWAFVLYLARFKGQRFDLRLQDELATIYPEVFNELVAKQFGEAVSEYYRNLNVPVDDHIVLGED